MRLLFDQNLSRHLVRDLAIEYPDSRHVTDVGLDTATDAEIWAWAAEHDYVIVSKDSDFRQLAFLHGPPPKAVWWALFRSSTADLDALTGGVNGGDRFRVVVDEVVQPLRIDQVGSDQRGDEFDVFLATSHEFGDAQVVRFERSPPNPAIRRGSTAVETSTPCTS